jgi:hypothetical protein
MNFPWCTDAIQQIRAMFEENIKEPMEILEQFKKYEYLLNVDKKELVESLFNNKERIEAGESGKASIAEIREAIEKYHSAAEEI